MFKNVASQNLASVQNFMDAVRDPKGVMCEGVPDGDGTYTTVVTDHLEGAFSAVAFASTGTLAVWGMTVVPSTNPIYYKITGIGGSATSDTLTWTAVAAAQQSNINTNFSGYRMIACRVRVVPTAALSSLNGHMHILRWPLNEVTTSANTTCAPTNIDALANQPGCKTCTINDPAEDGVSAAYIGTRAFSNSSNTSAAVSSYGWVYTGQTANLNEGFTIIWVGTAVAGAVSNDPLFKVEVDAQFECIIPVTAKGLWRGNLNRGDPSLMAMALTALQQEDAYMPIIWSQVSKRLARSDRRARQVNMPVTFSSTDLALDKVRKAHLVVSVLRELALDEDDKKFADSVEQRLCARDLLPTTPTAYGDPPHIPSCVGPRVPTLPPLAYVRLGPDRKSYAQQNAAQHDFVEVSSPTSSRTKSLGRR
jgi:hypothetical protein